jgi:hypothetical protein
MIMQIDSKLVSERLIAANRILEKTLLKLAW